MLRLGSGIDCDATTEIVVLKAKFLALSEMDMEIASGAQFFSVWAFSRLSAAYHRVHLTHEDYDFVLKWAGSQGIHSYVVVGLATSLVRILGSFSYYFSRTSSESEFFHRIHA